MKETLTLVEKTAFLKGMRALSRIPSEALAEVASRAREIHLDAGDVLFREGEPDRGTFLVVEGVIAVRAGAAVVRIARSGMGVGEFNLGEGQQHTTTAEAIEHTHVLNLTTEDVFDAMTDFPEFGVELVRGMARQVRALQSRVVELEGLLSRFHTALRQAGISPPDAKPEEPEPGAADNG